MEEQLEDSDFVRNIARNMVAGLLLTYAVTFGLCVWGLHDAGMSAGVAVVPAAFAGPYVGLLLTLIGTLTRKKAPAAVN